MAEKFARRGPKRGGAAKLAKGGIKKAKKPAGKETTVRISSKKNVSFAEELTQDEDSRPIKSVADLSFSSATKGILRKPKAPRTSDSPQKENRQEEQPKETPDEPMDDEAEKPKSLKRGPRPKITVKKSVKEKLLAMPKKERREFIRQLRAQKRPDFAVVQDAKKIWEKLRSSKTPADTKEELAQKLWEQVRKSAKKLIFAHDTSRIFQCLLTYASPQVRDEMFDELLPELIRMCRSNYAHFFVVKMLKHKEKRYREVILQAIRGHCVALFRSKLAAKILEYVYNDVATAAQRFDIVSEFYGKEYSLFKQMERNVKSIKEIEQKHPEKIELIVKNLEGPLKSIVEGEQLKHSLAHHLLWNYFTYCTKAQKAEMIESVKDRLPEIVHTREGAEVAMECIWNTNAKDRKEILKTFSGHAVQSANDQFARRVLFAIFDSVDDTVIINKNITKELADNVADLVYEKFGVSVLHYIVGPRDPHVFGKTGLVDLLKRGDGNEHSKKDAAIRYKAIFDALKDALLPFIAANMREVLTNKTSAVLVLSALKPHDADDLFEREIDDEQKKACFDAIAEMANDEYFPHNMENGKEGPPHILQAGPARFVLKSLLRVDGKQPTVKLSDSLAQLPADQLRLFCAQNSGCFDLLMMLQSGSTAARAAISAAISQKTLEKKTATFVGAGLLLEELRKK
ncbi:PUM-HD domain-containing protein [Aphelenchoides fujianensis]|nr:PUM-HD domain-containing protein [Aphelenchoides fujianensis]